MAGYIGSKASVVSSGAERKTVITATAGQTSLTGLSYTPTQVHVFQNGIRLVDGTDYTATNGSSITLTVGASTNDQIVVVSYATVEISDAVPASSGGTFSGDVVVNDTITATNITTTNIKATGETASRAVSGVAAAWINLNGQGTIEARDSFNVASLTDNGTSSYKVNVTNDFSSIDHAPTVSGSTFNGRNHVLATDSRTFNTSDISITASSWTIGSADFGASSYNADTKYLMSNSHGDLA